MLFSSEKEMGYSKIGPFYLSKEDAVIGNFVARLTAGKISMKNKLVFYFIIIFALVFHGVRGESWLPILLGIAFFSTTFVFPLINILIRREESSHIYYSEQGIGIESSQSDVIFKWDVIRSFERIGPRFYIHTYNSCSLIIPERVTSPENMRRLISVLRQNKPNLPTEPQWHGLE